MIVGRPVRVSPDQPSPRRRCGRPTHSGLPLRTSGDDLPSGPLGHLRRHPQLSGSPPRGGPPFSGRPAHRPVAPTGLPRSDHVRRRRWRSCSPARRRPASTSHDQFSAPRHAQFCPQARVLTRGFVPRPVDRSCSRAVPAGPSTPARRHLPTHRARPGMIDAHACPAGVRGCSSVAELQLPKLIARVRFPSPAPSFTQARALRRLCRTSPGPFCWSARAITCHSEEVPP